MTVVACVGVLATGCGGDSGGDSGGDGGGDGGSKVDAAGIFEDKCASCHGELGAGGPVGPNLQQSPVAQDREAAEARIREGASPMPPFEGDLSDEEIDAVADYVSEELAGSGGE